MNPKDRINELTFHKNFSKHDFETDCKVFKVLEELFKKDKTTYEFLVNHYFWLQKKVVKGERTMGGIQKSLYTAIVTNLDAEKAIALPKVIVKHLGARKGLQLLKFFRKMGLK